MSLNRRLISRAPSRVSRIRALWAATNSSGVRAAPQIVHANQTLLELASNELGIILRHSIHQFANRSSGVDDGLGVAGRLLCSLLRFVPGKAKRATKLLGRAPHQVLPPFPDRSARCSGSSRHSARTCRQRPEPPALRPRPQIGRFEPSAQQSSRSCAGCCLRLRFGWDYLGGADFCRGAVPFHFLPRIVPCACLIFEQTRAPYERSWRCTF